MVPKPINFKCYLVPYQIRLPSNAGGELKYVQERKEHRFTTYPSSYEYPRVTSEFKLTHRDHLTYVDEDYATGYGYILEDSWTKSVDVNSGIDTARLIGLQRSTIYRVGFWETGTSEFNISHILLQTRGKYMTSCHEASAGNIGYNLPLLTSGSGSHQSASRDDCFPALPDPSPAFKTKVDVLLAERLNAIDNFKDLEKELGLTPKT